MQEIWVVCVKTSLVSLRRRFGEQADFAFFDSFEKARTGFRGILQNMAFPKDPRFENTMFNKIGQITAFSKYIAERTDDPEQVCNSNYLSGKMLAEIQDALITVMSGQNVTLGLKDGIYTDGLIQVKIEDGFLTLTEADEVRYNDGVPSPFIKTNIFSMEEEQNYYLFISDQFDPHNDPDEVWVYFEKDRLR